MGLQSPNPARAWHLFLKPDSARKPNLLSESRYAQLRDIKKRSVRVSLQVYDFITPKIAITLTKTLN